MKKLAYYAVILGAVVSCSDTPTAPLSESAWSPPLPLAAANAPVQPIPNQYIVRFPDNEPSSIARARLIERSHGAVVQRVYDTAIKGAAFTMADDAAEALKSVKGIVSVEQDQTVHLSTTQSNVTWGIDRIDQRNLPLSTTYSYTYSGAGVTAYIIDTGINFTHSEYNGRASFGVDEIVPSTNGVDCNGHGSHVSGTVGGTTYGVAKNVSLVAVRVLDCSGSGSYSQVIAGVDWVTANAHKPAVANMSLGGSFSSALNAAVTNSIAAGVVFAVAAGNSAANACNSSPSSTPTAITTGATTISDGWASFSNFGSCVKILAPGVNITSAWIGSNTATNTISGTSMATPHVVGAAALYLEANPTATAAQVSSALTGNATSGVVSGVPSGTPNLLLYTGFLGVPPTANFTSTCAGLGCNFDASSSSALPSATYSWTFGDSQSGTGKTTSHTYATGGTYTVTLTVSDANGSSSKSSTVTVSAAQPPVASFTWNCVGQAYPTQCAFDASASSDAVGIVSYAWIWGNGTSETKTVPLAKKTYGSTGVYSVTLTVKNGAGLTSSVTQQVTVGAVANQPPTASISAPTSGTSVVQGTSVTFTGSGSDPEDGALTGASLVWTSSVNGSIGTGTSFANSTLSVGTHTITLTATDSKGATGTASITLTVTAPPPPPPVANFTWTCTGFNPHQCQFDLSSTTGTIVKWVAAYGDGQTLTFTSSAVLVGKHTYAAAGTYQASLTVTDNLGRTSSVTKAVIVP